MTKPRYCGLLFASATLLFGPLLSLLQNGRVADRFVNVVWDLLYGVGFQVAFSGFNELVLSRPAGFLGGIVWPVVLFALVFYCGKKAAEAKWNKQEKVTIAVLCVSYFPRQHPAPASSL